MIDEDSLDEYSVKFCLWCGKPFLPDETKKNVQKYCSERCRTSYKNHKAKTKRDNIEQFQQDNTQLRETIKSQEQALEYEANIRRRAQQKVSELELIIRTAADDLNVLFHEKVLVIDKNNPSIYLLNEHDSFLRMMEDWSNIRRSVIEQQQEHINNVKENWRLEREKGIQDGRQTSWVRALDDKYRNLLNQLESNYKEYVVFEALEDMKDDHRQTTGMELPIDGVEAEPLRKQVLGIYSNEQYKEGNHDKEAN